MWAGRIGPVRRKGGKPDEQHLSSCGVIVKRKFAVALLKIVGYSSAMSNLQQQITEIQARVDRLDLTMAMVLRRAKVPAETWCRWKAGVFGPTKANWDRITEALEDLEARLG